MYEPVTVAKVRKETTIKVPAGGWVLVGQPDEPLHKQISRRAELLKDGGINEDYERLLIGRLQATHPTANFVTKDQAEQAKKDIAARETSLDKSNKDAAAREEKSARAITAAAAEAHAAKLKEINAANDAIRNRDAVSAAKSGL